MRITVLGCRGSMPMVQKEMQEFGGDTSCYQVESQDEFLFLDAGSGLTHASLPEHKPIYILISHPHVDHLLGLPMFPGLYQRDRKVILYGTAAGGLSLEEQVTRLMGPPLWPVALYQYPADVQFQEICFPCFIGPFTIESMPSCHPGGSLVFRVSSGGKSIVYATDFEHTEEKMRELSVFAAGTDLLLEDVSGIRTKGSFGHSTAEAGKRVQLESGAGRLLLIHHDPRHTDDFLKKQEKALGVQFARQGEVIHI